MSRDSRPRRAQPTAVTARNAYRAGAEAGAQRCGRPADGTVEGCARRQTSTLCRPVRVAQRLLRRRLLGRLLGPAQLLQLGLALRRALRALALRRAQAAGGAGGAGQQSAIGMRLACAKAWGGTLQGAGGRQVPAASACGGGAPRPSACRPTTISPPARQPPAGRRQLTCTYSTRLPCFFCSILRRGSISARFWKLLKLRGGPGRGLGLI